jgi:hypothetical protein
MKANRFVIGGVILSVVVSAVALAWQLKENASFERFFRPLSASNITEAEFRSLKAELAMLEAHALPLRGIYPGGYLDFSDDRNVVTISVAVLSASLPANYEERKKAFDERARECIGAVLNAFEGTGMNAYVVKFIDEGVYFKALAKLLRERKKQSPDAGVVAIYEKGQLTMR